MRIRARRRALGLSQAELAGESLSASYVSLVEAGKRHPTDGVLQQMADRLGVSLELLRDGVDPEVRRRARLTLGFAELALHDGELEEAYRRFGDLMGRPDVDEDLARKARLGRALAAERRGNLDEAVDLLAGLAEEARRRPDAAPWIDVAVALCRCYSASGDVDLATDVGEAALEHARDLGLQGTDDYVRLGCTVLGAYFERGDLTRGAALATELVRDADAQGTPFTRGAAYWNAALVAEARGEAASALMLVDRALALFGEGDDRRNLARLRITYAWLLLHQSPPEARRALGLLDSVRPEVVAHGGSVDLAACETERSRALWLLGRTREARHVLEQSLPARGEQPRVEAARARLLLGRILRSEGDEDGCLVQCAGAAAELEAVGALRQAASAWRELGDLYRELDQSEEAFAAYDRALAAVRVASTASVRPEPSGVFAHRG